MNPYNVLGVSDIAEDEVVHAAYHALVKKHSRDDIRLRALNDANDLIGDPDNRRKYDRSNRKSLRKGKVIGDYRILEEIAEGGFGKTYLAEHVEAQMPVCIKHACSEEVTDLEIELLIQESKAVWDLRHWGIPAVRGIVKLNDRLAIVMS
mgnify:CR=1 FL=1